MGVYTSTAGSTALLIPRGQGGSNGNPPLRRLESDAGRGVLPHRYLTGSGVHFIHAQKANVLFFDGHVAGMGQPEMYQEDPCPWYAYGD